jgi:hypothetical protein
MRLRIVSQIHCTCFVAGRLRLTHHARCRFRLSFVLVLQNIYIHYLPRLFASLFEQAQGILRHNNNESFFKNFHKHHDFIFVIFIHLIFLFSFICLSRIYQLHQPCESKGMDDHLSRLQVQNRTDT